jgi:hypothetical protein
MYAMQSRCVIEKNNKREFLEVHPDQYLTVLFKEQMANWLLLVLLFLTAAVMLLLFAKGDVLPLSLRARSLER